MGITYNTYMDYEAAKEAKNCYLQLIPTIDSDMKLVDEPFFNNHKVNEQHDSNLSQPIAKNRNRSMSR